MAHPQPVPGYGKHCLSCNSTLQGCDDLFRLAPHSSKHTVALHYVVWHTLITKKKDKYGSGPGQKKSPASLADTDLAMQF